jgi:NitT/TauT family transport system substrate-binding protein
MEDLNGNRELLVELVPTFTEVSAETVENVAFPQWTSEVDVDQLEYMEDLMFEHGITAEEFDVTSIIAD